MNDNKKLSILMVEDEILAALITQRLLEKEGYTVEHALSGEVAISKLKGKHFDLALIDIDLGHGIDGIETAESILNLRTLPIIFLSARTEKEIIEKTERVASYGYVEKGTNFTALNTSIKMALKLFSANQRTLESERNYRRLINESPIPYALNDNHQNIVFLNEAFISTFGYTLEDIPTLKDWWPKAYPDPSYRAWVAESWNLRLEEARRNNTSFIPYELKIRCKNGMDRYVMASATMLDASSQGIHLVILFDITERKEKEEIIQNILTEKDLILKEIHHRIKNNMTTVSSLLTFHANSIGDQKSKEILYDASTRVQSMMVLYNKLYLSKNQNFVELSDYILSLLSELKNIFPIIDSIEIATNIEELSLTPKFLNPLGIILNELITNSIKYGFTNEKDGKINICGKRNNGTLVLTYSDNGLGYPEGVTFENSTGFGLKLIYLLVQQLNGSIQVLREENPSLVRMEFTID